MSIEPEDITILKRKTAPYYWPDTQSLMQLFLSVSAVLLVWYVVQRLLAEGGLKIDQSVRDLVVFILGIIFGCFKDVYGYTFGSSAGQRKQGEAITKSLEDKDKIIAGNVSTAADVAASALTAATVVAPMAAAAAAPAAAKVEAPPAAAEVAPTAAREAVAEAMAEQGISPKSTP